MFKIKIKNLYQRLLEKRLKKYCYSCGEDIKCFGNFTITCGQSISIGNKFRINEGCKLFGRTGSKIVIGDDVTLSPNVVILSSGYDVDRWISTNEKIHKKMETYIGNHVWIGCGATILGGVHIVGEYIVIAAGAVVNKDIEDNHCVYAGIPARCVKRYS